MQPMVGQWGMIPPGSAERVPRKASRPGQKKGDILATNNARRERMKTAFTFRWAWADGRRCLIPAAWYQEPYWGITHEDPLTRWEKSVAWRFARADGQPWMLAGLWGTWTDPESGELVHHYTMLTQNCDGHPLLALMHKPEIDLKTKQPLPVERQDKRTVVPIERGDWETWLAGTADEAEALIRVPPAELFSHGPADHSSPVRLPV
ncbi:MAG: SOS response-associated peptidase family protein [Hydrogenophaga sp.]|nr:SOS response-associated peptidase family protein [Hydrogenophaga sp.]